MIRPANIKGGVVQGVHTVLLRCRNDAGDNSDA